MPTIQYARKFEIKNYQIRKTLSEDSDGLFATTDNLDGIAMSR